METLQHEQGVTLAWHAFELRPRGAPPMPPEFRARIEAGRPQFAAMARSRYGLEISPGPLGIDSRLALIGDAYAQAEGLGDRFHKAAMRAYWQEAQSIDQREVLATIAAAVGLERAAFLAALDDPRYDAAVQADIDQAQAYGLTGVPALVFNSRYLVVGAQPLETLRDVVRRCEQE